MSARAAVDSDIGKKTDAGCPHVGTNLLPATGYFWETTTISVALTDATDITNQP